MPKPFGHEVARLAREAQTFVRERLVVVNDCFSFAHDRFSVASDRFSLVHDCFSLAHEHFPVVHDRFSVAHECFMIVREAFKAINMRYLRNNRPFEEVVRQIACGSPVGRSVPRPPPEGNERRAGTSAPYQRRGRQAESDETPQCRTGATACPTSLPEPLT